MNTMSMTEPWSASSQDDQVTISRRALETLQRRARLNADPPPRNGYQTSVVLSRADYDRLMLISQQYSNLTRNLLRGGVPQETVELLSQDHDANPVAQQAVPSEDKDDGGARLNPPPTPTQAPTQATTPATGGPRVHAAGDRPPTRRASQRQQRSNSWAEGDGDEGDEGDEDENGPDSPLGTPPGADYAHSPSRRSQLERNCSRSLQLTNLAEGTTHADITAAVRGGMLLDIHLRGHERAATISFANSADAKQFFDHVRRNDLYIRNRRIEVKWNDRHFTLPGHVANKIAAGATRNLVLHGYDDRHTEDVIREDLDHIHNLVVIKVEFSSGNCYIGLNSVHNAIYARQCMMSRLRYKSKKITYDADECAQPYPPPPQRKASYREAAPQKKPLAPTAHNRFHLLHLDGGDKDDAPSPAASPFRAKNAIGIAARGMR
ncbi:hypothetical protein VTJ83DRAFT_1267 [Remersonia thermophila]|uniref:RRM domain-containing protein n=1 Tax=Remersonia thermophila TaxID=72144 RepID=A0ABR4DPE6_9PEZI